MTAISQREGVRSVLRIERNVTDVAARIRNVRRASEASRERDRARVRAAADKNNLFKPHRIASDRGCAETGDLEAAPRDVRRWRVLPVLVNAGIDALCQILIVRVVAIRANLDRRRSIGRPNRRAAVGSIGAGKGAATPSH